VAPLVAVDHPGVVVEAVKLAEDRSGDLVVRLYEAWGGRARTSVRVSMPVAGVVETDLLERPTGEIRADDVTFRPFQIRTLRFSLAAERG
jgi:alpha-mannosidase